MVSQLQCSQVRYIETVNNTKTQKIFSKSKTTFLVTCELFLSMLCTELGLDPKIKVVTLIKYYNFAEGCTTMQSLQSIVQLRSITQLENESLHYYHDLEDKLIQVMNTKVVPYDILNMLKELLGSHKCFIHWLHVNPSICDAIRDKHM